MEIPLVLRRRKDGSFVYGLPLAYRVAMATVVAVLAFSLFMEGGMPGAFGWILIALTLAGGLYEESWSFDAKSGTLTHRAGVFPLLRRTRIAKDSIVRFRIEPYVRGTIPGSEDESAEKTAALGGGRRDDSGAKRARYKRPYLCLVFETTDGSTYFMNAIGARKGGKIKTQAALMAQACGASLVEG